MRHCFLWMRKRSDFLGQKSTSGEGAIKSVEITTEDLEYYMNLADKAFAGCERTNSDFERRSTVGKMLPTSIARHREIFHEGKSQSIDATNFIVILL